MIEEMGLLQTLPNNRHSILRQKGNNEIAY